ncbi:MAG: hypothetical protein P1S60_04795 [Anaerolineae bacterium]|nr:hypothetical protein [Anaerolineae bacterium]
MTLKIHITQESIRLKFGILTWEIPLDNVAQCTLDDAPFLMKYGGAGVHFMLVRKQYRASFNFLEHHRVAVTLKKKAGLVRDVSFSTRHPKEVIDVINNALKA